MCLVLMSCPSQNEGTGVKFSVLVIFFIMVQVQKLKTITNRQNVMVVLRPHFQILAHVINIADRP